VEPDADHEPVSIGISVQGCTPKEIGAPATGRLHHKGWRLLQADGVEFVDLAGKLGRGAMHLVCLRQRNDHRSAPIAGSLRGAL
jgi:hypothetical protein